MKIVAGLTFSLCFAGLPMVIGAQECGLLSVTATALDFDTYNSRHLQPTDAVGTLEVRCAGLDSGISSYQVVLGSGQRGESGTRQLLGTTDKLRYELFMDPARSRPWRGDGFPGLNSSVGEGSTVHHIYGRIFPGQNVSPGDYRDRVTVTLLF